jgi:hypothetical protein
MLVIEVNFVCFIIKVASLDILVSLEAFLLKSSWFYIDENTFFYTSEGNIYTFLVSFTPLKTC